MLQIPHKSNNLSTHQPGLPNRVVHNYVVYSLRGELEGGKLGDGSDCSVLVVGVVKKVGVVPNCDGVHGWWVWPN